MKMRPLAETDLARTAVLSEQDQWAVLRKHRFGRPPHSYNPVRYAQADILNRESPLWGGAMPTKWEQIKAQIEKSAKNEQEELHNLRVAKALHEFALSESLVSRNRPLAKWAIGFGQSVKYWQDYICFLNGAPEICFIDYRLSNRLNKNAMKFVFSVMHERTRAVDTDLDDVELAIYQFKKLDDGTRVLQRRTADGLNLFSFDELNMMIDKTYSIWEAVLRERFDEARKAAGGDTPMGF